MLRLAAAVATLSLCCSCTQPETGEQGNFIRQSPEQMVEALRQAPPARKLELYLSAMKRVRPRPVGLAAEIAQGGEATARTVARTISHSEDNQDRNNLLLILISMKEMAIFDSCRDPAIRALVMPRDYDTRDTGGQLLYALGIVDLCVREGEAGDAPLGAQPEGARRR